jgi:hypothetical protein
MSGAIHPLHQNVFMAWCLVKHRDNFTLTLPLPCGTVLNVCAFFAIDESHKIVDIYCCGRLLLILEMRVL